MGSQYLAPAPVGHIYRGTNMIIGPFRSSKAITFFDKNNEPDNLTLSVYTARDNQKLADMPVMARWSDSDDEEFFILSSSNETRVLPNPDDDALKGESFHYQLTTGPAGNPPIDDYWILGGNTLVLENSILREPSGQSPAVPSPFLQQADVETMLDWELVQGVLRPKNQHSFGIAQNGTVFVGGTILNSFEAQASAASKYVIFDCGTDASPHDKCFEFHITPSVKENYRARGRGLINSRNSMTSYFSWNWLGENPTHGLDLYTDKVNSKRLIALRIPKFSTCVIHTLRDEGSPTSFSATETPPAWATSSVPATNDFGFVQIDEDLTVIGTPFGNVATFQPIASDALAHELFELPTDALEAYVLNAGTMYLKRPNGLLGNSIDSPWTLNLTAQNHERGWRAFVAVLCQTYPQLDVDEVTNRTMALLPPVPIRIADVGALPFPDGHDPHDPATALYLPDDYVGDLTEVQEIAATFDDAGNELTPETYSSESWFYVARRRNNRDIALFLTTLWSARTTFKQTASIVGLRPVLSAIQAMSTDNVDSRIARENALINALAALCEAVTSPAIDVYVAAQGGAGE